MKGVPLINGSALYLEIRQGTLRALRGEESLELTLERQENGRLTDVCRERVALGLQDFLHKKNWQPRLRAFCAIGARGVSLRRLSLPPSSKEELPRLLTLQIESEFPLPPEALAWGYRQLSEAEKKQQGANARQEILVVAVKKEVLEDYAALLSGCGVSPLFTLAALARGSLCPQTAGTCALLDVGRTQSELIAFQNGAPVSIRIFPWGGETVTRAIQQGLGIGADEAEKLKLKWDNGAGGDGELGKTIQLAIGTALDSLAAGINGCWTGQKLFLTGKSTRYRNLAPQLAQRLRGSVECEVIESPPTDARSAAIRGLKKACETQGGQGPLVIRLKETRGNENGARGGTWKTKLLTTLSGQEDEAERGTAWWKWATLAVLLAVASVSFPYAEALLLKGRLTKKLAALKADRARLPAIDRELGFLQYVKATQPPYLDALSVLANAAQSGTRIDSLSMNRRGDLSLRGTMRGSQQVTEFRSKLVQSGFFSTVSVDEQTPSPDRQKVTVRITAQWKPTVAREHATIDPTPEELEKMKNRAKEATEFAMPPGMDMPMQMPSGMMPPGMPRGMPPQPTQPGNGSSPKNSAARKVTKPDMKEAITVPDVAGSESKTNEAKVETKDQ
jgi:Tfp pilus assembly PilM family ATPase